MTEVCSSLMISCLQVKEHRGTQLLTLFLGQLTALTKKITTYIGKYEQEKVSGHFYTS